MSFVGTLSNPHGAFLISQDDVVIAVPGNTLPVADTGLWGIVCPAGHRFHQTDPVPAAGYYYCCGEVEDLPAIIADDVALVLAPEEAYARTWWHASHDPQLTPNGPIHVGSLRASQDRNELFLQAARDRGATVTRYLYQVTMRPNTRVAPDVMVEMIGSNHYHSLALLRNEDAVRYVNRAEAPGSISVLANDKSIARVEFVESIQS